MSDLRSDRRTGPSQTWTNDGDMSKNPTLVSFISRWQMGCLQQRLQIDCLAERRHECQQSTSLWYISGPSFLFFLFSSTAILLPRYLLIELARKEAYKQSEQLDPFGTTTENVGKKQEYSPSSKSAQSKIETSRP